MLRRLTFFVFGVTLVVLWLIIEAVGVWPLDGWHGRQELMDAGPPDSTVGIQNDWMPPADDPPLPRIGEDIREGAEPQGVEAFEPAAAGRQGEWALPVDEPPLAEIVLSREPAASGDGAVERILPGISSHPESARDSIKRLDADRNLDIYLEILQKIAGDSGDAQD